jgi:hypothetical protein
VCFSRSRSSRALAEWALHGLLYQRMRGSGCLAGGRQPVPAVGASTTAGSIRARRRRHGLAPGGQQRSGEQVPDILAAVRGAAFADVEHVVRNAPALQEGISARMSLATSFGLCRSVGAVEDLVRGRHAPGGLAQTIALASAAPGESRCAVGFRAGGSRSDSVRFVPDRSRSTRPTRPAPTRLAPSAPAVPVLTADGPARRLRVPSGKALYVDDAHVGTVCAGARGSVACTLVSGGAGVCRAWSARASSTAVGGVIGAAGNPRTRARARVHALLAGGNERSEPSVVRSAGHAWRALDREARTEWLRVCTRLFSPAGPAMS